MAKRAILHVDLLGVQRMWMRGGAIAVKRRIEDFSDFVMQQIEWLPKDLHREGEYTVILAGDSVAVLCQDAEQAVGIGAHLFRQAFYHTNEWDAAFWLRGSVGIWSNQALTINTVALQAKGMFVGTRYVMDDQYLAAVALEKSGFRGMRLIIDRSLLRNIDEAPTAAWAGFKRPLRLVTRLRDCTYPSGFDYGDVLWMATDEKRFMDLKFRMSQRLMRAAADQDELVQAAFTRVIFEHAASLAWHLRNATFEMPSDTVEDAGVPSDGSAPSPPLLIKGPESGA